MAFPARPVPPEVLDQSLVRPHSDRVIPFPKPVQSPVTLRRFYRVTQGMVLLLSGATLLLYAATVWEELSWQKQYSYLLQLRQQRQELLTMTATLQQHLVESGISPAGTVVQTPAQSLFVTPAPARSPRPVAVPPEPAWPLGGY
ncbi:hypothetical protein [Gloeomargarita sp.]